MTTPKRVIVGTDTSKASVAAVRFAHDLAARLDADLMVVSAFRPPGVELSPENHGRLLAEYRTTLEVDWLPSALGEESPGQVVVRPGDPRQILLDVAQELDSDLIVLGRGGAGGVPGLLHVGSVVEFVAHHTDTPLAVIPEGIDSAPTQFFVGVDGSAESRRALRWAADLAASIGANFTPIAVRQPPTIGQPSPATWERRVLAEIADSLGEGSTTSETPIVTTGHIVATLLDTCAESQGTLVVGAKGVGGFTRVRVGGVAMGLLHHAESPFIMVPRSK